MKKTFKIILIIAVCILIIFILLQLFKAITLNKNTKENSYINDKKYDKLELVVSTSDINIHLSNENKIIKKENSKVYFDIKFENEILAIKQVDIRKFYEKIFNFTEYKLDLYLTEEVINSLKISGGTGDIIINNGIVFNEVNITNSTGDIEFNADVDGSMNVKLSTGDVEIKQCNINGDLKIEGSTGDVEIKQCNINGDLKIEGSTGDIEFETSNVLNNMNIKSSTGDVDINNSTSKDLIINISTGDITLKDTIIKNDLKVIGSTGDVLFDGFDANNINIELSTGNVKGTILTNKFFIAKSDTGKINVPETRDGGECRIKVSTGDIYIKYK